MRCRPPTNGLTTRFDGYSIVTTIDTVIQQYIESALQSAVDQYQPEGGAAIIVMDTNTGGILGLASYPNYDLNDPYTILDSYTLQQIDLLETEEEKASARGRGPRDPVAEQDDHRYLRARFGL